MHRQGQGLSTPPDPLRERNIAIICWSAAKLESAENMGAYNRIRICLLLRYSPDRPSVCATCSPHTFRFNLSENQGRDMTVCMPTHTRLSSGSTRGIEDLSFKSPHLLRTFRCLQKRTFPGLSLPSHFSRAEAPNGSY